MGDSPDFRFKNILPWTFHCIHYCKQLHTQHFSTSFSELKINISTSNPTSLVRNTYVLTSYVARLTCIFSFLPWVHSSIIFCFKVILHSLFHFRSHFPETLLHCTKEQISIKHNCLSTTIFTFFEWYEILCEELNSWKYQKEKPGQRKNPWQLGIVPLTTLLACLSLYNPKAVLSLTPTLLSQLTHPSLFLCPLDPLLLFLIYKYQHWDQRRVVPVKPLLIRQRCR